MEPTVVSLLEDNLLHVDTFESSFDAVQAGQHPDVVTVSCSDSRVLQDHVWGNDEPGRIFTCANIGNRVVQRTEAGEVVSGDVLFPIEHTGTEVAIVMGHTGCGAVTGVYEALSNGRSEPAGIQYCLDLLEGYLAASLEQLPEGLDHDAAINRLVEFNVDRQVAFLVGSDDVPETVSVIGVVYDFQDVYPGRRGEVHVINVNGEREVDALRRAHPEIDQRIHRLWEY